MIKILLIASFAFLIAFSQGTGNDFVSTGENNAGIGATAWTSPGNITADDNTTATCNAAASSQYLVGRNNGFTIPLNATIKGVTVRIAGTESSAGSETMNGRLQDASGALFGNTKTASFNGTGETIYTYGASNDLWGLTATGTSATLTPAVVNDADFGCRFWFTTAHNITVDYVTIAIEYYFRGNTYLSISPLKLKL